MVPILPSNRRKTREGVESPQKIQVFGGVFRICPIAKIKNRNSKGKGRAFTSVPKIQDPKEADSDKGCSFFLIQIEYHIDYSNLSKTIFLC